MAAKQTEVGANEARNRKPLIECLADSPMARGILNPARPFTACSGRVDELIRNFHHSMNRTPKEVKESGGVFEHDSI